MKKTLLATTLLVATAGLAAAEVNLSGSGRFGVIYGKLGPFSDTIVDTRLTINVDAKMETDGGVTFGGRIRFRHNDGEDGTFGSNALLYMETSGLRVEVGNANGAYDTAGLIWNSEIGYTDFSFGDPLASYIGYFESVPASGSGRFMGIFASYSMGDFTARVSYHDYDQTVSGNTETSVSVDYASGAFAVSAAYVTSEYTGQDNHFIGAQYTIGDSTNVGLLYNDGDAGRSVTLYGNHTMASGLTVAGYLTDVEFAPDTAIGIGASYPLGGGAAIKGAYHTWGSDVAMADLGVTFSF